MIRRMQQVLAAFAPHCADSARCRARSRLACALQEATLDAAAYPILNQGWKDDSYSCRTMPSAPM
ncbi:MAG: hypothetical protein U1E16_04735 [Hyphomicrobiales bacterium]